MKANIRFCSSGGVERAVEVTEENLVIAVADIVAYLSRFLQWWLLDINFWVENPEMPIYLDIITGDSPDTLEQDDPIPCNDLARNRTP